MKDDFKFKYVNGGHASGLFSAKGKVTPEGLVLRDFCIPYRAIRDTTTRDSRLVLNLDTQDPLFPEPLRPKVDGYHLVLEIYGLKAEALERMVDRHCSHQAAAGNRQRLEAEGQGHLFRVVPCPHCQASVDLSELDSTPYIYCRYCDTLFGEGLTDLKDAAKYRECDECGYYDRVQSYTEFYFYWLVVVLGYRYQRRHMCDACAASMANKLLALNSIFVLGVPNAIMCAVRARASKDGKLSSLSTANNLAKKGKLSEADQRYRNILDPFRDHPGVRYNQALAYLIAKQTEQGVQHLQASMNACPNYLPSLRLWHRITS